LHGTDSDGDVVLVCDLCLDILCGALPLHPGEKINHRFFNVRVDFLEPGIGSARPSFLRLDGLFGISAVSGEQQPRRPKFDPVLQCGILARHVPLHDILQEVPFVLFRVRLIFLGRTFADMRRGGATFVPFVVVGVVVVVVVVLMMMMLSSIPWIRFGGHFI